MMIRLSSFEYILYFDFDYFFLLIKNAGECVSLGTRVFDGAQLV